MFNKQGGPGRDMGPIANVPMLGGSPMAGLKMTEFIHFGKKYHIELNAADSDGSTCVIGMIADVIRQAAMVVFQDKEQAVGLPLYWAVVVGEDGDPQQHVVWIPQASVSCFWRFPDPPAADTPEEPKEAPSNG